MKLTLSANSPVHLSLPSAHNAKVMGPPLSKAALLVPFGLIFHRSHLCMSEFLRVWTYWKNGWILAQWSLFSYGLVLQVLHRPKFLEETNKQQTPQLADNSNSKEPIVSHTFLGEVSCMWGCPWTPQKGKDELTIGPHVSTSKCWVYSWLSLYFFKFISILNYMYVCLYVGIAM